MQKIENTQKMKHVLAYSLVSLMSFSQVFGQKQVDDRQQLWLGYFNQTRVSKNFGWWFDAHVRNMDYTHLHQTILRPGFTWFLNDNFRFTAGYAYIYNNAPEGRKTDWQEHRPWQQLWWRTKYNGFSTTQWLRLEERYVEKVVNDSLTNDYVFSNRIRYNIFLQLPLKGKELKAKVPYFVVQDEVFINAGKNIVYNVFDQNRFFVGLGYYFTDHLHVQLGYMNLFQQRASGDEFYNNHCFRLFLFHSLDFRKTENH